MNDDLISREALKRGLEVTQYNDIDDLLRTEQLIDNAPPVSHGEWIPVSERLPKIDAENGWKASDVVLVCLADEKIHMGFYCEDKKWRFCESGEEKEPFWKDVIAWQPLPEPYKEAENET